MRHGAFVAGAAVLVVLSACSSISHATEVRPPTASVAAHGGPVERPAMGTAAEHAPPQDEPSGSSQAVASAASRDLSNLSAARALASLLLLGSDGGRWHPH